MHRPDGHADPLTKEPNLHGGFPRDLYRQVCRSTQVHTQLEVRIDSVHNFGFQPGAASFVLGEQIFYIGLCRVV